MDARQAGKSGRALARFVTKYETKKRAFITKCEALEAKAASLVVRTTEAPTVRTTKAAPRRTTAEPRRTARVPARRRVAGAVRRLRGGVRRLRGRRSFLEAADDEDDDSFLEAEAMSPEADYARAEHMAKACRKRFGSKSYC